MSESWTWHGGGLQAARARFGDGPLPWIDLSTGINPWPWPTGDAAPIDWHRLPEPETLANLEAAAALHFAISASHVCAVPGSEIGLRLLGGLIGGPAYALKPSYRTHSDMFADTTPLDRSRIGAARGATLVMAQPNNPDGRIADPDTILALAEARGDGWLLIDEAFADCTPQLSVASHVRNDRRLIVTRSFGKFFGLAGLRLGFVIAPDPIVAQLRTAIGSWPLSAAAIAIGTAAYQDRQWVAGTRAKLVDRAATLDALLVRAGLAPVGACPLFRLVEVEDAQALFERLAHRAILTRPFAENPRWLRLGLPADDDARDRLEAALSDG